MIETHQDALPDQGALELGKAAEDLDEHPARRCSEIYLVARGDELHAQGFELRERVDKVLERTEKAIELHDRDRIDIPRADELKEALQPRPVSPSPASPIHDLVRHAKSARLAVAAQLLDLNLRLLLALIGAHFTKPG
jgi:hypothetical protein